MQGSAVVKNVLELAKDPCKPGQLVTVYAATVGNHHVGSATSAYAKIGEIACFTTARNLTAAVLRRQEKVTEFGGELIGDHPDGGLSPALVGVAVPVIDSKSNQIVGAVSLLGLWDTLKACTIIREAVDGQGFRITHF